MNRWNVSIRRLIVGSVLCVAAALLVRPSEDAVRARPQAADAEVIGQFVVRHCLDCHGADAPSGELDLSGGFPANLRGREETWEHVVRKLRARLMPPPDAPRPTPAAYRDVLRRLTRVLDRAAQERPWAGRPEAMRRMTRTEYKNAIRDLLDLDIDVSTRLPKDESSSGFDNVTVSRLSPQLMDRYVSAAQTISRRALGLAEGSPEGATFRLPADRTQEQHVPGLPLGTRGGGVFRYHFPQDGEYEVRVRLTRDRNEEVEGLKREHQLEILLDRKRHARFVVRPPRGRDFSQVDAHLRARIRVAAGPHQLGVTFLRQSAPLLETMRQPYDAHFNMHRHPRPSPALFQVSIVGPYNAKGPGDTPSRRRILVCKPARPEEEEACAEKILQRLIRRAYRRPVIPRDLERPLAFFRAARKKGGFEAGIELALSAILVNPHFLFRIECEPSDGKPGSPYPLSDWELASRLSFFLWSSLPDEPLLVAAEKGQLQDPEQLKRHVLRMLRDPKARSLSTNFAGQWLYLRNLAGITPDLRQFPDFDDNLREAMRRETELLFQTVVAEDRSVLDLLTARFTFLNERLARHYRIPHIFGSRFRRVELAPDSRRGGLLRHGSILTVTSYATRTSPVLRGHWVLKNLLSAEPPPPPADVPALQENTLAHSLTVRQRLRQHRADAACARCHDSMDPVGFVLENFDAVGRWRETETGRPIDARGALLGASVEGIADLERELRQQPDLFISTLAEKLLTFALGRRVELRDGPAIRRIVRQARQRDDRFSALIVAVVQSRPFRFRNRQAEPEP